MVSESESFSNNINRLSVPEPFSQTKLNDLVRDLGLSKKAAKTSRLQEEHIFDDSGKSLYFQNPDQTFVRFFSEQKQFVYCQDIPGLFRQFGVASHIPTEVRLFLDSSKQSLKCVLLHNLYREVLVGHFMHLRETYDNIKEVINLLKYHEHNWILWVDLKISAFFLPTERFTKYPCNLCM